MLFFPVYRERHPRQPVSPSETFEISRSYAVTLFAAAHPVSPLAATLMELRTSVANKTLTVILTPLDATLTKNRGEGCSRHSDLPTCKPSNGVIALCPLFAHFTQRAFLNSIAFNQFRTLSQRRGVYGTYIKFLKDYLKSAVAVLKGVGFLPSALTFDFRLFQSVRL
jgi:hypothetical protein